MIVHLFIIYIPAGTFKFGYFVKLHIIIYSIRSSLQFQKETINQQRKKFYFIKGMLFKLIIHVNTLLLPQNSYPWFAP